MTNNDTSDNSDDKTDPSDSEMSSETGGGTVLSPDELDIADSKYVEPLDETGRYVVSSGGDPPNVPDSTADNDSDGRNTGDSDGRDVGGDRGTGEDPSRIKRSGAFGTGPSPEMARTILADELERSNARYGLDIVAFFEGNTVRHRTVSDDVIATFEGLLRWYAGQVTDETPPDEVVEILFRESTFETNETPNLAELLETHDLEGTDSIDELVAAIRAEVDHD